MPTTYLFSESVEVFFDGDCPLCRREIAFLKSRDRKGRVRFTDIASPNFHAEDYGLPYDSFMSEIRGRLPNGSWIRGVEVFRRIYSAVGFGTLVWLTRLPLIRQILDAGYRLFARHRLRLTGRCNRGTCAV